MTKPISENFDESHYKPEPPEQFFPAQHLKVYQTSPTEQLLICECQKCLAPLSIEVVFMTPQNSKPRPKGKTDSKPDNRAQCPNCGQIPIYLESCIVKSVNQLPTSPWQNSES